jgi:hypothetical protein
MASRQQLEKSAFRQLFQGKSQKSQKAVMAFLS